MTSAQRSAVSYWQQQDALRRQQDAQSKLDMQVTIPGSTAQSSNYQNRQSELDAIGPRGLSAQLAANQQLQAYQNQYKVQKAAYDDSVTQAKAQAAERRALEHRQAVFDNWVNHQPKGTTYNQDDFDITQDSAGKWVVTPKNPSTPTDTTGGDMPRSATVPGQGDITSTPGTGAVWNNPLYNKIADWARQAGWDETEIPTLVPVIMQESTGNPLATHSNPATQTHGPSTDYGIAQINDRAHPDLMQKYDWKDPVQNLMAAKEIHDAAGGFKDWVAYTSGKYRNFIGAGAHTGAIKVYTAPYDQPSSAVQTVSGLRQTVVTNGKKVIGLNYVWGGESLTQGVDCSGLVKELYDEVGIHFPHSADQQSHTSIGFASPISKLRPGDLVAFQGGAAYGPDYRGHIAIYIGNNQILEAGDPVRISSLNNRDSPLGIALYLPGDKTKPTGPAAGSVPRPSGAIPGSTPVSIDARTKAGYIPPPSTAPRSGSGNSGATNPPTARPNAPRPSTPSRPSPKPKPKPKSKPKAKTSTHGATGRASKAV